MRAVNLIPPEERRGERAPLRTGALPYVLVGALAAALVGVSAMAFTSSKIADREAQAATLEVELADAEARAEALRPYADFAALSANRDATVNSLAESRFDWDRVLRELALVLPEDVWLTKLTGTVEPAVSVIDGADVGLRAGSAGPALAIIGCASSQQEVAGFLQTLKDIDGVTRVGIESSELPVKNGASGNDGEDCRTRNFIAQFKIVAAFDEAVVPAVATAPATPPASAASAAEAGGVADGKAETERARRSTAEGVEKARDAAAIVTEATP